MAGRPLDVTLVAGRRPELLARTLASFAEGLFAHFDLAGFHANIDPIFGDASDHARCREVILSRFPDAAISEPPAAGFGAAVQRVWAATRADLVFHLEDDWLLNEPVGPEDVLPLLTGNTRSVALVAREFGWNGRDLYNVRRKRRRFLGIPVGRRTLNVFGTSPRFLEGAFARRCAGLIDPALDPEKQMRPPGNPALIAYLNEYRCRFLPTKAGAALITDIGREWRDARGIEKVVEQGVSRWRQAP
ncbi:MAG: hypothetical protein H6896_06135 [Rhodovulum sp.]|nr:hypothetical protein [Paracoccaceae bacterium]MCC0066590.1 hypothetical protein [Rhodovulum sp.]